ncbi:hypothetical protein AALP_AA5G010200 [Arabis alpina]|uniref:acid phosphatase n=1 Tax=Arabis alpina TaxID=50452 RepID=A0A087GU67_ARAAL|nr:hypothetical protein AALP_AA5G010200 [Arabis alpina]
MKTSVLFGVILMFLCIFINGSLSKLQRLEHPVTKSDGSLSFLVVGDWGRKGEFNQSLVAHQMGIVGEQLEIDFVVSVGDNFYDDGLIGENDPSFEASFSHIYTQSSLQKQWYSVLGNHDYRGNVSAQLSQVLTQKDWRWFCRRSFVLSSGSGMVEIFFVDTNPFVEKYFTDPGDHTYDWSNVLPRKKYISNLLHDLDLELKKSHATWKFVVGHHGIKTAGDHGVTQELVDQLVPIMEENKVDLYINGHDHCLQHIGSDGEIQFLTSGGGSKAWRGGIMPWDPKELKLYYDGQGDNFYDDGLNGENDPSFEASFSHIYTQHSLQKQWYSILGNHDYMGNVSAQLSQVLTQKDWRWFCRRSFILSSGMVEFFFVDTNPFVEQYFTDPGDHTYDWSNVLPRKKYISNLLHDLDLEIKKSRATWKFVVGHHGIKTAGQHGVTQELVDLLLPILEENKVDLYINGHDHCLQHIGSDG